MSTNKENSTSDTTVRSTTTKSIISTRIILIKIVTKILIGLNDKQAPYIESLVELAILQISKKAPQNTPLLERPPRIEYVTKLFL